MPALHHSWGQKYLLTPVYNYFETKEEIFLGFFRREYDRWNEDLTAILNRNEFLTRTEPADKIFCTQRTSNAGC